MKNGLLDTTPDSSGLEMAATLDYYGSVEFGGGDDDVMKNSSELGNPTKLERSVIFSRCRRITTVVVAPRAVKNYTIYLV